jgi:alpha/beta superfamily hydrolase
MTRPAILYIQLSQSEADYGGDASTLKNVTTAVVRNAWLDYPDSNLAWLAGFRYGSAIGFLQLETSPSMLRPRRLKSAD